MISNWKKLVVRQQINSPTLPKMLRTWGIRGWNDNAKWVFVGWWLGLWGYTTGRVLMDCGLTSYWNPINPDGDWAFGHSNLAIPRGNCPWLCGLCGWLNTEGYSFNVEEAWRTLVSSGRCLKVPGPVITNCFFVLNRTIPGIISLWGLHNFDLWIPMGHRSRASTNQWAVFSSWRHPFDDLVILKLTLA